MQPLTDLEVKQFTMRITPKVADALVARTHQEYLNWVCFNMKSRSP